MTNERAKGHVRRVTQEHVHGVGEHGLGVDANPAATRGFQDDLGNYRRVHASNRRLPPPSVPREMGVQADGMVRTACSRSDVLRVG